VVQVLVLRLRMDDACFGIIGVELDDMRFAVVDPDDTVIVAHSILLPCDVGRKVYLPRMGETLRKPQKGHPNPGRIPVRAALSEYSQ
jgi:hypothetical protein